MLIKVDSQIIASLNPCKDRLDNWTKHYSGFKGDLVKFLDLKDITSQDKIWVAVRLLPRFLAEVFAIDCAVAANAAAAAYAAANAAAERQRQIEALIYLIQNS